MSRRLRKLRVKQDIIGVFEKGEILLEYPEFPNKFYSESNELHNDVPIDVNVVCQYFNYDDIFEEIDPKLINLS
jgi:hypothetical protein